MKKNKCPLCDNKMNNINGYMTCPECGYRISHETSHIGIRTGNTANPNKTEETSDNHKKLWHIIFIIVILGTLCGSLPVFFHLLSIPSDPASDSKQAGYTDRSDEENVSFKASPAKTDSSSQDNLPESDMFRRLISGIFDKPVEKITSAELAQIISLHLSKNESGYRTICYTLQDGTSGELHYDDVSVTTSDLRCFSGLESLNLEHDSLSNGDLDGLNKLTELRCGNTPAELAYIIDPKQLTSLGIGANVFLNTDGIESFSNLSCLHAEGRYLTDISSLSSLKKLKSLEIINNEQIDSFKVLYDMTGLETLSIDAKKLRDIGFISNMPALTELSIQNSEVMQVDALADCKNTLRRLALSHNYQITDYHVVSSLSNLTHLTLFISYSFDDPEPLPELANMPEPVYLSISNYDDISQIANAPKLQELTLTDGYAVDFSSMEGLSNLTHLNLLDMSLEPSSLKSIMKLTSLESINLNSSYIWGNVEGLLKLPNLKEFNMNDCTAGFDMENLTRNETLNILHMSHVTLKTLVDGKWDYNATDENNANLSENTDIFQYYPNLTELYLAGNKLADISFAANLSHLKVFDITDNYITSLQPLSTLNQLESVMCATNSIADDGGLEDKILTEN